MNHSHRWTNAPTHINPKSIELTPCGLGPGGRGAVVTHAVAVLPLEVLAKVLCNDDATTLLVVDGVGHHAVQLFKTRLLGEHHRADLGDVRKSVEGDAPII